MYENILIYFVALFQSNISLLNFIYRTNSSPPDLYSGRCVAIDSSERSVNDWVYTRKDEYSQAVPRDINGNSLVVEDEKEKSSRVLLDGSQTNSHTGKSDEDTGTVW